LNVVSKKLKALVTSGPTRERLDPVRYISNDSSGKQGHAIAAALAKKGVEVTLISGAVHIPDPAGVKVIKVESALEMLAACEAELPTDIAICAAAVCDWRPETIAPQKIKKQEDTADLNIRFVKNPDILKILSNHIKRPKLVIGFAAETENLTQNAKKKLKSKGCDIIIANDVSKNIFASDENEITVISNDSMKAYERMSKEKVAELVVGIVTSNQLDFSPNSTKYPL
jgi:phosphopantothenoylcysteine decarboxylase/phosphopantothenate--cysteine ligase